MSTIGSTSRSRSAVLRRLAVLAGVLGLAVLGTATPAAASPRLTTVAVSAQTGTAIAGTGSDVTFQVNVTKANQGFFGNGTTAGLTVAGLTGFAQCAPTTAPGPCWFFSPASLSWTGNATGTQSSTLTIRTAAAPPSGTSPFTVTAVRTQATADTASGGGTLTITALPTVPQTITFDPVPDATFGDPDFALGATASSGLAVTYAASDQCTVTGSTVHITGAGSCTITASQAGDATYLPAADVPQSFAIAPDGQTITFDPLADKNIYDNDFPVNATASSGLPVTFSASAVSECTVAGNQVHLTGVAGQCEITASQAGNADYYAAPDVLQTFDVVSVTPTYELYAVTGTMTTLPGTPSLPVWGYNTSNAPVTAPGGPTLTVTQGEQAIIVLHDELGESTSLVFRGQNMPTDQIGAAAGGLKAYTFTPTEAGTFIYEAGPLPNSQHQVAMGLHGTLVVQPPGGSTQPDVVVVVSEIDPALNANPTTFDMRNFAPKYTLINGLPYPVAASLDTDQPIEAGDDVLVRYVNAGINYQSMSVLGANQTIVADDGHAMPNPYTVVAQTIGPGQTTDAVVHVSTAAAPGTKLTVFDAGLQLRNRNRRPASSTATVSYGGAMAFIDIGGTGGTTDAAGPLVSGLSATTTSVEATINDATTGGNTVNDAEYFIDAVGVPGSGTHFTFAAGVTVAVSATFSPPLPSGTHSIFVRGHDSAGNWGPLASTVVSSDTQGPTTSGLSIGPSPTNGTVDVALHATGSDVGTGGANVTAAEYSIDGGTAVPMTLNATASTVGLDATIPAATVAALSQTPPSAPHMVNVRSRDALGNWGAPVSIALVVDKTGPETSSVTVTPNVTNGVVGVNSSTPAVRFTASATDPVSNIVAAEGFIDTVGAAGTGFILLPSDGAWNSKTEGLTVDIPLTTIDTLPPGSHTVYVRAKDASGNWETPISPATTLPSTTLIIDKTAPTVTGIALVDPTPTTAASVAFTVTFSEPVTGVTASNFTLAGTAPGTAINSVSGSGATRTVTAGTGTVGGTLGLNLTTTTGVKDVAGNALSATGVPFIGPLYTVLTPPLYFSTAGNSNPPGVGGTADDADIYYWNGAAFSRVIDANGTGSLGLPAGANVDGFDRVDATHFYMSFNGTVAVPVLGNVQDEDVVYYNAGIWSLFFDGTPTSRGLVNSDVDAISVVGSTLYFSLDDTDIPTGVAGTGDDADIYSWNGTSMARVINASGAGSLGWSSNNVDGLVWVDATHLYLSYSNTSTTLPGTFGTVQDEDVVYYSAGTWSVYFDGTAKGLTSNNNTTAGNLNVDAFDLP